MFDCTCLDKYGNQITALHQWDSNQVLYIEDHGFDANHAPKFHFCNQNSEKALLVDSEIDSDGVMTVMVPNVLLTEHYTITAYVYLEQDDSGKTVEVISIPVRQRPMPENYEYIDDPKIVNIVELAAEMRELMVEYADAEALRVQAETVRVNNEDARKTAETERATAETERQTAETSRSNAESARQSNENKRIASESERVKSENARIASESAREAAEDLRSTSESERIKSETARESNESVRIANEKARQSAEATRSASETARIAAEDERELSELAREDAESLRASAELIRESQEAERQTNTSTAISEAESATDRANSAAAKCEDIVTNGYIPVSEKGVVGGVATLDEDGTIPAEQIAAITIAEIDAMFST